MRVEERKVGEVLVVQPAEDRLDARIAQDFKNRLNDLIRQGHRLIVLNLAQVQFMDSSGLGAMVSALKTMGGQGDVVVCGVRTTVMMLFELTRMNQVFRLFPSETEAVTALSK